MDNALFAFLKIMVDVEVSNSGGELKGFTHLPEVVDRLGKDFRVDMGFGLHYGWAIEGKCSSTSTVHAPP